MAKLITVAVAKWTCGLGPNHHLLGGFTQCEKAWAALQEFGLPEDCRVYAGNSKPLPLNYQTLTNRLRKYGTVDIYESVLAGSRHVARVFRHEINVARVLVEQATPQGTDATDATDETPAPQQEAQQPTLW